MYHARKSYIMARKVIVLYNTSPLAKLEAKQICFGKCVYEVCDCNIFGSTCKLHILRLDTVYIAIPSHMHSCMASAVYIYSAPRYLFSKSKVACKKK